MRAFADHLRQERTRAELRRAPAPAPLFAQRAAPHGTCACGGGCPRCAAGPALQKKLEVSRPGDADERQADRVAEQVMRAAAPGDGARVEGAAPAQVDAARGGGGRPLATPVREFFEPRFGHAFGDVRVHTDAQSAQSARSLNALAYTVGTDVVFAEGQYAPETQAGRTLLAHELAHVVQQRGGAPRVQRQVAPSGCTSEEASAITSAVSQARTDLGTVVNLLSESTLSQPVKNALWLAFRDDSDFIADEVVKPKLTRLRDTIELGDYTCVNNKHPRYAEKCETDEQTYGFVSGYDVGKEGAREFLGPINFCMPRLANFPKPQQVRAVVHEASHRFLNALDLGYFTTHGNLSVPQCQETARTVTEGPPTEEKSGTAGDTPSERLMNADAIACFIYFAVYAPSDFVTTTASQYRGGELRIRTETRALGSEEVVGDIYTQTGAETEPTFHIAGEPDLGRFQYRWRFEAGGKTYIPRARSGGKTAATFDARNTAVYIGQATRSTLDGSGVTEGTLICEAQLVEPFDPDPKTAKVKPVKKVLKIKHEQDRNDPNR